MFFEKKQKNLKKCRKALFILRILYYNKIGKILCESRVRDGEENSTLKQKYTITIGDVEMNVICEESPETVEKIVGHVDRKIREINLGSARCSKHEAALLCALDYCTEKLNLQAKLNEVEEQNDKLFRALERLQRENEKLGETLDLEQTKTRDLTLALESAHAEIAQEKLRAQAAAAAAVAAAGNANPAVSTETVPVAVVAPIVKEEPAAEFEQLSINTQEVSPDAPEAAPAPVQEEPKSSVGTATPLDHIVQKKKTYSYRSSAAARAKNKVGNMFDTLTFHDDE